MNRNSSSTSYAIKRTLFLLISSIILLTNTFSQNSLRTDIFSPTLNLIYNEHQTTYQLSYERRLLPHFSILGGVSFGTFYLESFEKLRVLGVAPYIEYRSYLKKDLTFIPHGFFIDSYLKCLFATYDRYVIPGDIIVTNNHGLIYGIGLDTGYKLKIRSFSIELLIGGALGGTNIDFPIGMHDFYRPTHALTRFEFSIGYEFKIKNK